MCACACVVSVHSMQNVWRESFTKRGFGGPNALVWCENWYFTSSTNSKHVMLLFRIRNTTPSAITWRLTFDFTSSVGCVP
jgi:hypothetical protein